MSLCKAQLSRNKAQLPLYEAQLTLCEAQLPLNGAKLPFNEAQMPLINASVHSTLKMHAISGIKSGKCFHQRETEHQLTEVHRTLPSLYSMKTTAASSY